MEIELKLLVNAKAAEALRRHPLLKKYASVKPHEQKMSDVYFDTPDMHIRRSDAGLRVRRVNSNWVQTLKGGSSVDGGLHSRHEWETQVTSPAPDLAELRDMVGHKSAWDSLLHCAEVEDHLVPIFTTDVKRWVWELRLPHGDQVECVLDLGTIECNLQHAPISELELELKLGDPIHLFDFALTLLQDIPMQIGSLTKADRGYALYAPLPPAAVKAAPLKLSKRATIEQAFQAIVGNCMMQIQANARSVAQKNDAETLHQMRVGLRRLRSAFSLFNDMLQAPAELLQELDWLATKLGAARDWDVLTASTLPMIDEAMPDEIRIAEVTLAASVISQEKHKAVATAINSPRYTRLILRFTRWSLGCGWRDAMRPQEQTILTTSVTKFSRIALRSTERRLQKRGRKLQQSSEKVRHRVRVAVKETRYTLDFFQSLYRSKRVQPLVEKLSTLQDALGWLNDAAVADRLLKELQDGRADLDYSAGFIRGYLIARIENDDKKIRKLWSELPPMKLCG